MNKRQVSWGNMMDRVEEFLLELSRHQELRFPLSVYGIPRGGSIVAGMIRARYGRLINDVSLPEIADVIVDDVWDTGETARAFEKYGKPMWFLWDKRRSWLGDGDEWLVFPWEFGEDAVRQGTTTKHFEGCGCLHCQVERDNRSRAKKA